MLKPVLLYGFHFYFRARFSKETGCTGLKMNELHKIFRSRMSLNLRV